MMVDYMVVGVVDFAWSRLDMLFGPAYCCRFSPGVVGSAGPSLYVFGSASRRRRSIGASNTSTTSEMPCNMIDFHDTAWGRRFMWLVRHRAAASLSDLRYRAQPFGSTPHKVVASCSRFRVPPPLPHRTFDIEHNRSILPLPKNTKQEH